MEIAKEQLQENRKKEKTNCLPESRITKRTDLSKKGKFKTRSPELIPITG